MTQTFDLRGLLLQVRTALVAKGFQATMAQHDEMLRADGLRALVGGGCGGVRVRIQRPSTIVRGRWVQICFEDVLTPEQVSDKMAEIDRKISAERKAAK